MEMTRLLLAGVVAAVVSLAGANARADARFDACVRKLCVDTTQRDCWIKAGAELCNKSGSSCRDLQDHTSAKAIRKAGKRWELETEFGTGWVNERLMMVSGDLCD
jgi:hypothetical protein